MTNILTKEKKKYASNIFKNDFADIVLLQISLFYAIAPLSASNIRENNIV